MLHILIVRSIFCPNEEYLKICATNLINLFIMLSYQKSNTYIFTLYLCGWVKKQFIIEIEKTCNIYKDLFFEILTDFWSLNYGKYKILNNILKKCSLYDNLFYSDHDIIFEYSTDLLFLHLDNIINYKVTPEYKVGIVMLNQKEDVRHQYDIYENEITLNNINYIYPYFKNFTSIASGCFYSNCKIFYLIKEFIVENVYGLDDYYIIERLYKENYIAVVLKDYYVTHPYSHNRKYNDWKKDNIINIINNNNSDYYEQIEYSMNMWI